MSYGKDTPNTLPFLFGMFFWFDPSPWIELKYNNYSSLYNQWQLPFYRNQNNITENLRLIILFINFIKHTSSLATSKKIKLIS